MGPPISPLYKHHGRQIKPQDFLARSKKPRSESGRGSCFFLPLDPPPQALPALGPQIQAQPQGLTIHPPGLAGPALAHANHPRRPPSPQSRAFPSPHIPPRFRVVRAPGTLRAPRVPPRPAGARARRPHPMGPAPKCRPRPRPQSPAPCACACPVCLFPRLRGPRYRSSPRDAFSPLDLRSDGKEGDSRHSEKLGDDAGPEAEAEDEAGRRSGL